MRTWFEVRNFAS